MNRFIIEDKFVHKGYQCVCTFNRMGFRCGYVGVNQSHPYYKKDYYNDGPDNISCHWGLTYSDFPYFEDSDLWYFGFDCGHYVDVPDMDLALKYGLIDEKKYAYAKELEDIYSSTEGSSVKDINFVKENCKLIVEQLDRVKNKENV